MRTLIPHLAATSLLACFAGPAWTQAAKSGAGPVPVAVIDGKPILDEELSKLVEGKLRRLRFQEYQVTRAALEDLINQRVLAAKAQEQSLTAEELLHQEVDDKLAEPTDAEVESFYGHQRNLANVPYEQVKDQLRASLKQQHAGTAREDYIARLREAADITVTLPQPKFQVAYDPSRAIGNPKAPITIVEFSDFQCPYCRKAAATLRVLRDKYRDEVRIAFRDFPLTEIHPNAHRAAEAARCANQQGKFWVYHDLLFSNQDKLSDLGLAQAARSVGLDLPQFDKCLTDGTFQTQVDEDRRDGMQTGVSGTPGFFINGIFLDGAQPLATFEAIIKAELISAKRISKSASEPVR